jgi:hypothetical protein
MNNAAKPDHISRCLLDPGDGLRVNVQTTMSMIATSNGDVLGALVVSAKIGAINCFIWFLSVWLFISEPSGRKRSAWIAAGVALFGALAAWASV